MQVPQFNPWVNKPRAIVRISNHIRPTVARFVNRQGAEEHYLQLSV